MKTLQPRVAAGTRAGGRYSAVAHMDPGTDVLVEPVDWSAEPPPEAAFGQLQGSAAHFARRGMSVDDLVQESAVQYYKTLANRAEAVENGETVAPIKDYAGFIHTIVRRVALGSGAETVRAEDRRAIAQFDTECGTAAAELGRPLTVAEKETIGEQIYLSMPPERRPTRGFYKLAEARKAPLGLDVPNGLGGHEGRSLADTLADEQGTLPEDFDFDPDSTAGFIEGLHAEGGRGNFERSRAYAWDALAERHDGIKVQWDSINERTASQSRKLIATAGGVRQVAQAWRDETISGKESDALFAPFGTDLSFDDQSRVVDTIDRAAEWGDELWDSAVTASTKKRTSGADS